MRTITVFTKPAGAAVFIDGRYMGSTTTLANVGGYHDYGKVTVEAPGGEFDLFIWRAGNQPARHHVTNAVDSLQISFQLNTNVDMPAPPQLTPGQCAPAPDPLWPTYGPDYDPYDPRCKDVGPTAPPPPPLPEPPPPPPTVARARPSAGKMAALIGVAALTVGSVWWSQRG